MNFSSLPSNFSTDITTPWEFVRSVLLWIWGILTTDFIHYGNLSFSIFDVFVGFTILAILLRLVFMRMHLASAVGNLREIRNNHGPVEDDNGWSWYERHTYPVKK